MKKLIIIVLLGIGVIYVARNGKAWLSRPANTSTHHGTVKLFGQAVMNRDLEGMKKLCKPEIQHVCEMILSHQNVKDVELDNFSAETGAPGAVRTSSRIFFSANKQTRLIVNLNLEKQGDGTWVIYELSEQDPFKGP